MYTTRSRTNPERKYFFECLNFVKPEHLSKGLFVGIPCELESTLTISSPVPVSKVELDGLRAIINDCASPELQAVFGNDGYESTFRYLKACGVFEAPYQVHTVHII